MKFNAFIFARGGSKGLPKKNILNLGGIPLVAHSINHAKKIKNINKIFVSTDSKEISEIAQTYGAYVIERPSYLATDYSPEWLSWQHAIKYVFENYEKFEGFISLPTTSPLRSSQDIENCLSKLKNNVDFVITISDSKRSPWFNMVTNNKEGILKIVNELKNKTITRRQDVPQTFDITTVAYVSKADFILNSNSIWDGVVKGVKIPQKRSIDIDTKMDFEIAKYLYENNIVN